MFEDGFDFESEDEMNKPLEEGTIQNVKLRQRKDKDTGDLLPLGDLQTGKTKKDGTPYVIIPFEVDEGEEHAGHWASIILFARPNEWRFRKAYEVVTEIDLKSGGKFDYNVFVEKLKTGVFKAELGPQKPRDPDEPAQYTDVKKLLERVSDRDDSASIDSGTTNSISSSSADIDSSDELSEEDVPF